MKSHELRVHMKEKHHKCRHCQKTFLYPNMLAKHVLIDHSEESLHDGGADGNKAIEFKFKCGECGHKFKRRDQWIIHQKRHQPKEDHKFSCEKCGKRFFANYLLQSHLKTHDDDAKTHVCSFCDKRFLTASNRLIHERTHTGQKDFPCNYCEKEFSAKKDRMMHEMVIRF